MEWQLLVGGCFANWNVPTSSPRIEICVAEAQTFLVVGLCFTLLDTLIFHSEDWLVPGWDKSSTSNQGMQFFFGKFQLSGQRIAIYLAEPESLLLERLSLTLVGTSVSNGSGPSLRVRVWVGTEPEPDGRSRSSINPNCRFGYRSIDISLRVWIGRVPSGLYTGSVCKFIYHACFCYSIMVLNQNRSFDIQ